MLALSNSSSKESSSKDKAYDAMSDETDDAAPGSSRPKASRLERLFSVDKSARHGRLSKHQSKIDMKESEDDVAFEKRRTIRQRIGNLGRRRSKGSDASVLPAVARARVDTAITVDPTPGEEPTFDSALVITGSALAAILHSQEDTTLLFAVATCSKSVIACRVSPSQKSALVRAVKSR